MKKLIALFIIVFISAQTALSCTAVFANKGNYSFVGRTMDWKTGDTDICLNKSGAIKTAVSLQDKSAPLVWKSKFNSITFNMKIQFNIIAKLYIWFKDIQTSAPSCGMNEKALWGGSLWVHPPPTIKYPKSDLRPSINDWQLLEYVLDTSGSVKEAISNIKKVRVSGFKEEGFETDLHWFFADVSGDSAIVEFVNRKLRVHRRPSPAVMANSFYEHENGYLKKFIGFGGSKEIPFARGEMTTENRFVFAASSLNDTLFRSKISVPDIFCIMKTVTQTNVRHMNTSQAITQWTVVYDLKKKTVSWNTRKNPKIHILELNKIDFSGRTKNIDIEKGIK